MPPNLEEVPGLYGPISVPERLIQTIWRREDFETGTLGTTAGQSLRILSPGKWNLAGEGPDFLGADLEIEGKAVRGDVEIHFRIADWRTHGHHVNPNFDRVVLHVVLFPPTPEDKHSAETSRGFRPPTLVLLPLLHESLEEYAEREAIRALSGGETEEILAEWLEVPLEERRSRLLGHARERWKNKLGHARGRLLAESWPEACHQFALEILGYRRNRAPMAAIALTHPLSGIVHYHQGERALFSEREGEWKLAGLRPANHPKARLRQYLDLIRKRPDWPDLLGKLSPDGAGDEKADRKSLGISALRKEFEVSALASRFGGSRLDTLVVDGFLPLLAAKTGNDLFPHWFHWYAGDVPERLKEFLREAFLAGPGTGIPFSNGLVQGTLGHFLERNLV